MRPDNNEIDIEVIGHLNDLIKWTSHAKVGFDFNPPVPQLILYCCEIFSRCLFGNVTLSLRQAAGRFVFVSGYSIVG